jgi:hypothetical protein
MYSPQIKGVFMDNLRSVNQLPKNYQLRYQIDMKKDKMAILWMNVGAFVLMIPILLFLPLFHRLFGYTLETQTIFWLVPTNILVIIVHEVIHAMVFKQATTEKVKFQFHGFAASASVPGVYFYKPHYMKAGLAPAIYLNLILLLGSVVFGGFVGLLFFLNLAIHFASCVGDFFVARKLLAFPDDTLIEDYGIGMRFYCPSVNDSVVDSLASSVDI